MVASEQAPGEYQLKYMTSTECVVSFWMREVPSTVGMTEYGQGWVASALDMGIFAKRPMWISVKNPAVRAKAYW